MKLFSRVLFFIILGELIVGGGGRLIAFGPVSLRMILFSLAMIITAIEFIRGKRMPRLLTTFLFLFLGSMLVAMLIGIFSGAQPDFWVEDVKPLLYVLILPYFWFVISDLDVTQRIGLMIIGGAMIMASAFFTILALIHTGTLPFLTFYDLVIGTGEFFFRAETTFFYKGFVYFCIALIFLYFLQSRYRKLFMVILAFAILATFTRGFIFALAITCAFFALIEKRYQALVISFAFVISVIFFAKPIIYQVSASLHWMKGLDENIVQKDRLLGNRDESDAGRFEQLRQVFERVTPFSLIAGHGFGNGVPARPVHMEISYLEIFHKQGLLGLAIWGYLFYILFTSFSVTARDAYANAFFYSACFLFFQSLTNQFINNPIGLSFVLLSVTWLQHQSKKSEGKNAGQNSTRLQKGAGITAINF